ncbi:MAG: PAS domain-containing protein [Chloroflexota bacterium]|nr:PAS domain-containing protein [Chloroflexota bacterium]
MTLRERIPQPPPVKIQTLRQRVQSLYQQAGPNAQSNSVLSRAFEELAHALEELQSADRALQQQREEALNKQTELKLESQRYKDLFEHAPAGYIVTSVDGAIRQANPTALALLETSERAIVGRPLAVFLPDGQRRAFRDKIAQLLQASAPQEWTLSMSSWEGGPLDVRLTASVLRGTDGRPLALYWLICALGKPCAAE